MVEKSLEFFFIQFCHEHFKNDNYNDTSLDNGLVLIKLKNRVDLDGYTQLACLPDANDVANKSSYLAINNTVTSTGWDELIIDQVNSQVYQENVLTEFSLKIYNISICSDLEPNTPDLNPLICAGIFTFNCLN